MRRHDAQVTGTVLAELFETRRAAPPAGRDHPRCAAAARPRARRLRPATSSGPRVLPTALAVLAMIGLQRITGLAFNPLDLLALLVVLGVSRRRRSAPVHRFVREEGDLLRTLAGAVSSIVISGATTIRFGALSLAHRGSARSSPGSQAAGIGLSLLFTLFVLPMALCAVGWRWLDSRRSPMKPASRSTSRWCSSKTRSSPCRSLSAWRWAPVAGPPPATVILAIVAVVALRTAAMAFNRIVDRAFDARNPRSRALVTGAVAPPARRGSASPAWSSSRSRRPSAGRPWPLSPAFAGLAWPP
ncbi:MAG: UbiA family prenyltransferase [Thermoanaerobaculia bacterium]